MRTMLAAALIGLMCVSGAAQSTLSVTGDLCPGATVTASVSGAPSDAMTFLALGEYTGSTTFSVGILGSFTIDLDSPFIILPMGPTDTNGGASMSMNIPAGIPASVLPSALNLQAGSVEWAFGMGAPTLTVTTSNVAAVSNANCP